LNTLASKTEEKKEREEIKKRLRKKQSNILQSVDHPKKKTGIMTGDKEVEVSATKNEKDSNASTDEKSETPHAPTKHHKIKHQYHEYNDNMEDRLAKEYPMRFFTVPLPGGGEVYLNGLTSLFGGAVLWGLAIWCTSDPEGSLDKLSEWQLAVTEKFTWFYIVANPAFTFFVFWLAIRYGDVKLGKKDEEPEFDDISYFMMLFSAGVAVGLFFYGVSEPLWHQSGHWFAEAGYRSQDEIDQWALMLTMYHWGFAGWSPYIVVAIAAGLASYRFDLPMTVRSALYCVFGNYTWGWIGDIIDGFSMIMTVGGVCTSLGLGAMQITAGAKRMGWMDEDISEDDETDRNVIIIWSITLIATVSVVSGLSVGIKLLSQIGFGMGLVLLILVLIMEKTNYLFNLHVQTIGYYFQWCLLQVPFWTDAFGQLL
jgi:choline-glycine betaine transporter